MRAPFDERFPATLKGLHAALDTIERFGAARNLNASLVSRARIVVEELFTNTIKHGHGGESDGSVRLCLKADPVFRLTFEDEAPHFDPTQWQPGRAADVLPDARPEGQAGIAMVLGLSSKVRHRAGPKGNRLAITIEP